MSVTRKNIVIIGAGFAGVGVWNALKQNKLDESQFDVVLVNPSRDHFFRISAIRAAVTTDGNFHERSWAELVDEKFNNGTKKLVIGSAVSIEENADGSGSVILDNGKSVPYAYLVIATGSSWEAHLNYPHGKSAGKAWAQEWQAKIEKAESVVLVGGGVVGIGEPHPALGSNSMAYMHFFVPRNCRRDKGVFPCTSPILNMLVAFTYLFDSTRRLPSFMGRNSS